VREARDIDDRSLREEIVGRESQNTHLVKAAGFRRISWLSPNFVNDGHISLFGTVHIQWETPESEDADRNLWLSNLRLLAV
jgi:hypothetical protein